MQKRGGSQEEMLCSEQNAESSSFPQAFSLVQHPCLPQGEPVQLAQELLIYTDPCVQALLICSLPDVVLSSADTDIIGKQTLSLE